MSRKAEQGVRLASRTLTACQNYTWFLPCLPYPVSTNLRSGWGIPPSGRLIHLMFRPHFSPLLLVERQAAPPQPGPPGAGDHQRLKTRFRLRRSPAVQAGHRPDARRPSPAGRATRGECPTLKRLATSHRPPAPPRRSLNRVDRKKVAAAGSRYAGRRMGSMGPCPSAARRSPGALPPPSPSRCCSEPRRRSRWWSSSGSSGANLMSHGRRASSLT